MGVKSYLMTEKCNADQTLVNFDMPRHTTELNRSIRVVFIKAKHSEKRRCTVMIAIRAVVQKLRHFFFFKGIALHKWLKC